MLLGMSAHEESWEFGYEYKQGFFPAEMLPPDQDDYMRLEEAVTDKLAGSVGELTKSYGYNLEGDISIEFGNRYNFGSSDIRPYITLLEIEEEVTCELELTPQKNMLMRARPESVLKDVATAIDSAQLNLAERTAVRYLQSVLMYKYAGLSFERFADRHGTSPDEARRLAQRLVDVAVSDRDVPMFCVNDEVIVCDDWKGNILMRTNSAGPDEQDDPWLEVNIKNPEAGNKYELLIMPDSTARLEVAQIGDTRDYLGKLTIKDEDELALETSIAEHMIMFLELFTAPFKQDLDFLSDIVTRAEIIKPQTPSE